MFFKIITIIRKKLGRQHILVLLPTCLLINFSMKVSKNTVVTLTYTLRKDNAEGDVIQKVDESKPFIHLFGTGTLLPAFESSLNGLESGENFAFNLTAEEAYGNSNEEAIIELEKEIFEVGGLIDKEMIAVGKIITMQDQDGNPLDGMVVAVKDNGIIMDFNHPLAGKNLHFSGTVLDIRDPSENERSHKHVHGNGGYQH